MVVQSPVQRVACIYALWRSTLALEHDNCIANYKRPELHTIIKYLPVLFFIGIGKNGIKKYILNGCDYWCLGDFVTLQRNQFVHARHDYYYYNLRSDWKLCCVCCTATCARTTNAIIAHIVGIIYLHFFIRFHICVRGKNTKKKKMRNQKSDHLRAGHILR